MLPSHKIDEWLHAHIEEVEDVLDHIKQAHSLFNVSSSYNDYGLKVLHNHLHVLQES